MRSGFNDGNSKFNREAMLRQQEMAEKEAAIKTQEADIARRIEEMNTRGPGYRAVSQNAQERKAGVTAPGFEGLRDVKTGQLLDQYKFDPNQSEAVRALREQAMAAPGESPWAKMQLEKQAAEQANARGQVAQQQATAQQQAMSGLARQGGISSGARTRMAMQGARDQMMARQGVANQGMLARFGIQGQDIDRKQQLLASLGDTDLKAQESNINALKTDVQRGQEFDMNRYGKQMEAYGAQQTAAAQRAAGGGGKCFHSSDNVVMYDLTTKKISELEVGERLLAGGELLEIRKYEDENGFMIYDYEGVLLTGSHAVKESGEWKRVSQSRGAIPTTVMTKEVYGLVTENHVVVINGVLFADDVETNDDVKDETLSLKQLNAELR